MSTELPVGWVRLTLDQVADVRLGRQRAPKHESGDNQRRYLRAANVTWRGLDLSDVKSMNFEPIEFSEYRLRANDILLSEASGSASEVGKPAICPEGVEDLAFQNTLIRVRPHEPSLAPFFYWQFLAAARRGQFADSSRGVGIHHLGAAAMTSWPVVLAPLNEQQRIVAALESHFSRIDEAVAALKEAKADLKRYRASVLQAAVEGRLVPTEAELARKDGREFETGAVLLERILIERRGQWEATELARLETAGKAPDDDRWKAKYVEPEQPKGADLPSLPEGWTWASLDQLLREDLRNGRSAPSAASGLPTLSISAVTQSDFSSHNIKKTQTSTADAAGLWLEPGDIFVQRSNTPELVGSAAMYRGPSGVAIFPDLLIRVRPSTSCSSDFIEVVLRSEFLRAYFRVSARGIAGSMPKISQQTVARAPIPLPPLAEQRRIVEAVDAAMTAAAATETSLDEALADAERLRAAVLQWAFEGRLVDPDPEDEPAADLLARIRAERASAPIAPRRRASRTRSES